MPRQLAARGTVMPIRRSLGLPVGMSRIVPLPRAPADREWEQLIAEFRTIFDAQGAVTTSGGLREWSQGDVSISIEPTTQGYQLRLTAANAVTQALNAFAGLMGTMAVIMGVVVTAAGKGAKALPIVIMFGGMGLASFVGSLLRAPAWARERERQMAAVARAVQLLSDS